ncbi:hypothetical protein I552_5931 [Mycobacterium xenopi 3993]|nr:hypothetical protein I552_5931 [Mycobacterium xenopi 3993]
MPRGGADVDAVLATVQPIVEAVAERARMQHWTSARRSTGAADGCAGAGCRARRGDRGARQ